MTANRNTVIADLHNGSMTQSRRRESRNPYFHIGEYYEN